MSALAKVLGLAVIGGGIALIATKARAASGDGDVIDDSPLEQVTGASGQHYQVKMIDAVDTSNGRQLTFQVLDMSGHPVLAYAQFQGDNAHRILTSDFTPNSDVFMMAFQDFGIGAVAA